MNVTLRTPKMMREQFLDWVERQEAPYEFDGFEPVAMNASTVTTAASRRTLYFAGRELAPVCKVRAIRVRGARPERGVVPRRGKRSVTRMLSSPGGGTRAPIGSSPG